MDPMTADETCCGSAAIDSKDLSLFDRILDDFERNLRSGRTSLELVLAANSSVDRLALLSEMLPVEWDFVRASGSMPALRGYLDRFPDLAFAIADVFDHWMTKEPKFAVVQPSGRWTDQQTNCFATIELENLTSHAKGGLGEVFEAIDARFGRSVAVKRMQPQALADPVMRDRFLREAELTGRLEHPAIVPIYGFGKNPDGSPFYAMRFIRGESFREAALRFHQARPNQDQGKMSELRQLLGRFVQACNAIAYAHCRGVIHRDLKPANIMLGQFGETYVVDWGLAKAIAGTAPSTASERMQDRQCNAPVVVQAATFANQSTLPSCAPTRSDSPFRSEVVASVSPSSRTVAPGPAAADCPAVQDDQLLTEPGQVLGTPSFMSPEQASGFDADAKSDVYSLGATLYFLLAGRGPFQGNSADDILAEVRTAEPPLLRLLNAAIPEPLEAICHKAMAKKPAARYATALDLACDVERYLADEPLQARPEPFASRLLRWLRKHPGQVGSLAATILVGLFALAAVLGIIGHKNRELAKQNDQLDGALARESAARKDAQSKEALANANAQKAEVEFRRAKAAIDEYFTAVSESQELRQKYHGMHQLRLNLLGKAQKYYDDFLRVRGDDELLRFDAAHAYQNLGLLAWETGRPNEAVASYLKGIAALTARDGDESLGGPQLLLLAKLHSNLTGPYQQLGRHTEAIAACDGSLRYLARARSNKTLEPFTAREEGASLVNKGTALMHLGRAADAVAAYQDGAAKYRLALLKTPSDVEVKRELAIAYNNLGALRIDLGDLKAAETVLNEALKCRTEVWELNRQDVDATFDVSQCLLNLGNLRADQGNPKGAFESYDRAIEVLDKTARSNPSAIKLGVLLGNLHHNAGILHRAQANPSKAADCLKKGLEIRMALAAAAPTALDVQTDVADSHTSLGNAFNDLNDKSQARQHYESAFAIWKTLKGRMQLAGAQLHGYSLCCGRLADFLAKSNRLVEASQHYDEATSCLERIRDSVVRSRSDLHYYLKERSRVRERLGKIAEAKADLKRLLQFNELDAAARKEIEATLARLEAKYPSTKKS